MIPELYGEYRPDAPIRNASWKQTGPGEQVGLQIRQDRPPSEETSRVFWHPGRFGAKLAPESFRTELHRISPLLEVAWHPLMERWLLWCKDQDVKFRLCPGWRLITILQWEGGYLPLDGRVLALAWSRSSRAQGEGHAYFDRILQEIRRGYVKKEQGHKDYTDAVGSEVYDYQQIKNIGTGSKFANYHSSNI